MSEFLSQFSVGFDSLLVIKGFLSGGNGFRTNGKRFSSMTFGGTFVNGNQRKVWQNPTKGDFWNPPWRLNGCYPEKPGLAPLFPQTFEGLIGVWQNNKGGSGQFIRPPYFGVVQFTLLSQFFSREIISGFLGSLDLITAFFKGTSFLIFG